MKNAEEFTKKYGEKRPDAQDVIMQTGRLTGAVKLHDLTRGILQGTIFVVRDVVPASQSACEAKCCLLDIRDKWWTWNLLPGTHLSALSFSRVLAVFSQLLTVLRVLLSQILNKVGQQVLSFSLSGPSVDHQLPPSLLTKAASDWQQLTIYSFLVTHLACCEARLKQSGCRVSVCVCVEIFFPTNLYLQAGLTDVEEIWHDGRSQGVASHKIFW